MVALEATGAYWKAGVHTLEASGEMVLANPRHVRAIPGRKRLNGRAAVAYAAVAAKEVEGLELTPPDPR